MSHAKPVAVYLESGTRRVFAAAFDWPGWCRSGKGEERALDALGAARSRYAVVAAEAGVAFPTDVVFDVVERLLGTATTDFGAPGEIPARDAAPLTKKEAERLAGIVAASWMTLDRVVAIAPAELRKGPRGGGRDRDAIVAHVIDAEVAYARKLGIRAGQLSRDGAAGVAAREAIIAALRAAAPPTSDKGWPLRYAARRIAWHALDHAWEIEDRSGDPDSQ